MNRRESNGLDYHRDLQQDVVFVNPDEVCTEQLGCDAGFVAVCYYDFTISGKSKSKGDASLGGYLSGCFPQDSSPTVTQNVGGVSSPIIAACGPCNCFSTIPTEIVNSKSKGDALVPNGADTADFSTTCPPPPAAREPEDPGTGDGGNGESCGGSCSSCEYGDPVYRFSPFEGKWEYHNALAKTFGCELASISSADEQAAAVKALEPYINFPYSTQNDWKNAFVYIGGVLNEEQSNPESGYYVFDWSDGSGSVVVENGSGTPYSDFNDGDPNGVLQGGDGHYEPYLALSLNEADSFGIQRGKWVDYSNMVSPGLYKCCVPSEGDFIGLSVPYVE